MSNIEQRTPVEGGFSRSFLSMRETLGRALNGAKEATAELQQFSSEAFTQFAVWLKETSPRLFAISAPVLLVAACGNSYGDKPISLSEVQAALDAQRAGAATQELSADQLADLQVAPTATATPRPTRSVTPTKTATPAELAAALQSGAEVTATVTPRPVLEPTVQATATEIEVAPREVTVIAITKAGVNVRFDHSTTAQIAFQTQDNGITLEAAAGEDAEEFDDGKYTWFKALNPDFGRTPQDPQFVWVANVDGVSKEVVIVAGGTGGLTDEANETVITETDLQEASKALGVDVLTIETQATVKKAIGENGIIVGTKVGDAPWTAALFPTPTPLPESGVEVGNATIESVARMMEPFELAGSKPIGLAEGVTPEQASLLVNQAYVGMILEHNPNMTPADLARIIREDGTVQIKVLAESQTAKTGRAPSIVGEPQVITVHPKRGISYQRFTTQGELLTNIMGSGIQVEGQFAMTGEIPPESLRLTYNGEIVGAFVVISSTDARVYTYADKDGQLVIGIADIGKNSNTAYLWGALVQNTYPEAYVDKNLGGGAFSEMLRDKGLGKEYNEAPGALNRVGTQTVQLPSYLQREQWLKTNPEKTKYIWTLLDQSTP